MAFLVKICFLTVTVLTYVICQQVDETQYPAYYELPPELPWPYRPYHEVESGEVITHPRGNAIHGLRQIPETFEIEVVKKKSDGRMNRNREMEKERKEWSLYKAILRFLQGLPFPPHHLEFKEDKTA